MLDFLRELLDADGLDQDLDAGLVLVVSAAIAVVHADRRLDIRQHVLPRQVVLDHRAQDRRAAQAATGQDAQARFTLGVLVGVDADVVHLHHGAVVLRGRDRDLELARQEGEFRLERAPLAQQFGQHARVHRLVRRNAGEVVGGDVAHAVARGLDGVHLDAGQLGQHVGHALQLHPVVLDVLARGEVAIAAVVLARDMAQLAHLLRRQQAVRNRHAQHVGMALHVQAVLQAQRQEFFLGQLVGQAAAHLVTELGDALGDDALVILVVLIHGGVRSVFVEFRKRA
ncbi:hypothetical protein D3C72_1394190 [compost metagenome]